MKPGVSLQRTTVLPSRRSQSALEGVDRLGARRRAGHDLEQAHVARRVEEVGDHEVGAQGPPARRRAARASGIVEVFDETIEPGLADRVEAGVERPLGIGVLDDRLDDPVGVGHELRGRPRGCRCGSGGPAAAETSGGGERFGSAASAPLRPRRRGRASPPAGPAFARCAAMPAPIVPAPITAARSIALTRPPRARWRCPGRRRCTGSQARSGRPRGAAAAPPCR